MRNTKEALKWILSIFDKHRTKYQIQGGLAARLYGSKRRLADIDISIPEKDFPKILPDVKRYVTYGPVRVKGKMFDALFMQLRYKGQVIELDGAHKTKIFNKATKRWMPLGNNFSKSWTMKAYGIPVRVILKKSLIDYKRILSRGVDKADISYLEHSGRSKKIK